MTNYCQSGFEGVVCALLSGVSNFRGEVHITGLGIFPYDP